MAVNGKTIYETEHANLVHRNNGAFTAFIKNDTDDFRTDSFNNADMGFSFIVLQLEKYGFKDEAIKFRQAQIQNIDAARKDDFKGPNANKHWYFR